MAKRALLIGINQYANPSLNLRGCLNDVESMARLLAGPFGFAAGEIEFLRDIQATRTAIMQGIDRLLSGAKAHDTVVFAFSGHGTQVPSAVENDKKDECIVPYEASLNSLIKDDELFGIINRYVTPEMNFTAIYDCCHSGTMTRDFMALEDGAIVEDVVNRCVLLDELIDVPKRDLAIGPYNVLAACRDAETAADVRETGPERMARGAFSFALHNFLSASRDTPVALAEPQIKAGIEAVSRHGQTPVYTLADPTKPILRYG